MEAKTIDAMRFASSSSASLVFKFEGFYWQLIA
jgi:hypothetical protein